jgi:hypothetical protein
MGKKVANADKDRIFDICWEIKGDIFNKHDLGLGTHLVAIKHNLWERLRNAGYKLHKDTETKHGERVVSTNELLLAEKLVLQELCNLVEDYIHDKWYRMNWKLAELEIDRMEEKLEEKRQ